MNNPLDLGSGTGAFSRSCNKRSCLVTVLIKELWNVQLFWRGLPGCSQRDHPGYMDSSLLLFSVVLQKKVSFVFPQFVRLLPLGDVWIGDPDSKGPTWGP